MNPTHPTPSGPVTLDAEVSFLGCLMRCDAPTALRLLAGMEPDDATTPIAGEVLAMAIRLTAQGIAPDPAVLLAEARRTGRLDTVHKYQLLTDWLIDTYRAAPDPVTGPYLKTAMLEAAYRHALREHAHCILARIEHAGVSELDELATLDDRTIDLEHRHRQSLDADSIRPIAPTVPSRCGRGELSGITERLSGDDSAPEATNGDTTGRRAQRHSARAERQRGEAA
ncbi:hypothetical protein GIY23_20670 [Allosaccharopolyspora coralli]|uniref:Uncharacterized protein n=1 Tax=Allosaccharopolyspora coralli TaxID=2665642 RepID=A0A5Q3QAC6_9PSEU|nr:hypothetical protein [Allosaccharopolyspora coralli]QGK71611.1 hypothetical protein GIY23_20670 [Allosaccharopolyspora coralli]